MTDESLILSSIGTGRNGARQVGAMLGYKPVPHGNFPDAVLPVEISFTRASTGMEFVNGLWQSAAINMPRRYNDSYLNEPLDQNTCPYSTTFSNAAWVAVGTATKNPSALPTNIQGVTPYDIAGLGAAGVNFFYQSLDSNTDVWYKVFIRSTVIGDVGKTIRLTSNAGLSVNITLTEAWQEYSVFASGAANNQLMLSTGVTGTPATACTISYCGIHTTNSTSPIITAGSAVTRLADVPGKSSCADIIGQTEGTVFLDSYFDAIDLFNFYLTNGGTANCIGIESNSGGSITAFIANGGATQVNMAGSAITIGGRYKVAICYALNNTRLYINGVLVGTDTSCTIPTCNQLMFSRANGTGIANQRVNETKLFKTALSDADAIALTTI